LSIFLSSDLKHQKTISCSEIFQETYEQYTVFLSGYFNLMFIINGKQHCHYHYQQQQQQSNVTKYYITKYKRLWCGG